MPFSLQVKLLGVLQDMKIQRVGGTKPIEIDVRVIAATNANLEKMIKEKLFREGLFFRINVLSIQVPSLRDRSEEDIITLLMHFLEVFNKRHNKTKTFSPSFINLLLLCELPGNIRELKNLVERLVVIADEEVIDESILPAHIVKRHTSTILKEIVLDTKGHCLKELVSEQEKRILQHYLSYPNNAQ